MVLIVLLLALTGVCVYLAPRTRDAYQEYRTESEATPTPTADNANMMAVTLDPNATPTPTMLILKLGTQGDEVKKLQERLYQLGYYTGEIDGQYGQGTAQAVIAFQNQHGIAGDGLAGEETRQLLYSDRAEMFQPTPTPTETPSVLSMGDRNDAVKAMQARLKELGYLNGNADGDFGGATKSAVLWFQTQNGETPDGIAGAKTLALLFSDSAPKAEPTPTPDPNAMPMLVNRTHPVDGCYRPADLVLLKDVLPSSLVTVKGSDCEGDRTAAQALITMFEGAKADGVTGWQISAGYRTVEKQQALFDEQVREYETKNDLSHADAVSATRLTVADPGASEHHLGLAFDLTVPGAFFKDTEQAAWLAENCWDYGFILRYTKEKEQITGFLAEPWHVRYVGVEHARVMHEENLCLEEYISRYGRL